MEKNSTTVSRRSFVKYLSIAPLAFSPLLTALRAEAAGVVKPRLLYISMAHGPGGKGMATGSETIFTPSPWLSPLERIKRHVILVDGLQGTWWGNAHNVSYRHVLTGCNPPEGSGRTGLVNPSIDVVLGDALKGNIPAFRLHVRAGNGTSSNGGGQSICYSANGSALTLQSARDANKVLLNNIGAGPNQVVALQKKQKRLLDEMKDDLKSLSLRINANERTRVAEMAKAFDEATSALGLLGRVDVGGICQQPKAFAAPSGMDNFGQNLKMQLEHMKLAFACGLTQVGVMTLSEVPHDTYSWSDQLGKSHVGKPCPTEDFHQCVAHYNSDPDRRLCFEGSVRYQINHIVDFAQQLDQIKEANGKSMLENTVIVITGEVGDGSHEVRQKPHIIIGGSGAPGLRTGRFLKVPTMSGRMAKAGDTGAIDGDVSVNGAFSSRTEADLLRDLLGAMGVPQNTFGSPYLNRGRVGLS
ncbi:MAG: DUF1552 domain-containing protein [Myxococcales bacterium]|nr:DUF1552 domain-containing protein [Myxococcales bacterium]